MSDTASLLALRQLLSRGLFVVLAVVVALVGPLGYAMTGQIGLWWAIPGVVIWTLLFAYVGAPTGKSPLAWGLAGGLICGTVWALGEVIATELILRRLGTWTTLWTVGLAAGLGGGALVGATFGRALSSRTESNLRVAALALGAGLGFSAGLYFAKAEEHATLWLKLLFLLAGTLAGLAAALAGRGLGLRFRPSVIFFDQLWPYLTEMAIPLAAFAVGYFCLTLAFAGFYGAIWRLDAAAFRGLTHVVTEGAPQFWDFVYFSLMTASTANTEVSAVSRSAQALVAVEVIVGLGWLIVVFGALSAHLAPRLEAIAATLHSRKGPELESAQAAEQADEADKPLL